MSRRSFFTGITILAAWLITMGYLLRNHYILPEAVPAYTSESLFGSVEVVHKWRDVEEYMIIKKAGQPIGGSLTEIRQTDDADTTLTYAADFRLAVKLSPLLPYISVKGKGLLDKSFDLSSFHAEADLGPADFAATGAIANQLLHLRIDKPGGTSRQRMALKNPISLAEAVRPAIGSQLTIAPGNRLQTPVIDPLTGENRGTLTITVKNEEKITVNGEEVEAYRVISSLQDIETVMWVDSSGQTLKRNLVGDLTMERASRDDVLKIAPVLEKPAEIPPLNLAEFADVPVQQTVTANDESANGTMDALRRLLQ